MNRQSAQRQGSVVIELAIVLPVLMLIVFGTMEICNVIKLKQSMTIAAYEGVIVAVIPGATSSMVEASTQQVLDDRGIHNSLITVTPADFDTQPAGTPIQVRVSAPCNGNCMLFGQVIGDVSVTGEAVFAKDFE